MPKVKKTLNDSRTALYQAFWLKALTMDEAIRFPHKTESDAKYFRLALYRAVAPHREDPLLDAALHEATQMCTVGIDKDKTTVLLKKKAPETHLLALAQQLGIDTSQLQAAALDTLDKDAEASLDNIMKKLETEGTKSSQGLELKKQGGNRYYTRDEEGNT